jgi:RNA polymerase sigma factor (sigma-70 family)
MVSPGSAVATDEQLVAAARDGSDEAFEALFTRYRDRIIAQVRSMVHDQGRAEDIVQETFISALRSLRASDQEIVFRPWIHQIARNACIDHLRRVKRTDEISIDSDDFHPDFDGRLAEQGPATEITVLQRQDIDDLQQAFGGLPASQHEILVLREFEGLSYQEIGRRMRLTPAAVESMLSRARRSLKGQYDEIATGERCRRMPPIMAAVASGLAGKRDRRTLERHLRHCRGCRQEAFTMGLEAPFTGVGRVRGALSRAAALLPLPWVLRRRVDQSADASAAGGASAAPAHSAVTHLSAIGSVGAEQTASAIQKAVAVVAVAAVAGGGGLVAKQAGIHLPAPKLGSSGTEKAAAADVPPGMEASRGLSIGSGRSAPAGGAVLPAGKGPAAPALGGHGGAGILVPGSNTANGVVGAPATGNAPAGLSPLAPGESGPGDATTAPAVPALPDLPGVNGADPAPSKKGNGSKGKSDPVSDPPSSPASDPATPSDPAGYQLPRGIIDNPGLKGRIPPGVKKKLDGTKLEDTTDAVTGTAP